MNLSPSLVAEILERQGVLTPEQATELRKEGQLLPQRLRDPRAFQQRAVAYELVESLRFEKSNGATSHVVNEEDVAKAIAADAGLEYVRIDTLSLNADLIEAGMSRPFARRHRMIPLEMVDGKLRVACANPFDIEGIDSFRRLSERDLVMVVASEPDILKAINEFYGLRHSVKRAEKDLTAGIDLGNLEQLVRMKSEQEIESSDQHVVNAVEFMLQHAYDTRASDIHVEPKREASA